MLRAARGLPEYRKNQNSATEHCLKWTFSCWLLNGMGILLVQPSVLAFSSRGIVLKVCYMKLLHKPRQKWHPSMVAAADYQVSQYSYLTIIPRARMGYESIAHEAFGLMGHWLRGYEGERNNCFSKIQLVGPKNIKTKYLSQVKARHQSSFTTKTLQIWRRLSQLLGYNI